MPRKGPAPEKAKDFKGSMKRVIKHLGKWKFTMMLALTLALVSAMLALIAPNKLSDFADVISEGLVPNTKKLEEITKQITFNLSSQETMTKLYLLDENLELTDEEKIIVDEVLPKLQTEEDKLIILSLPKKVLLYILEDIKVDNTIITKQDQYDMLMLTSKMDKNNPENNLSLIDELPKSIYSLVEPQINMNRIKKLAIFMGTLYIISAIFNYIQSYSLTTVSNKFANQLRGNISLKINKLPLKYFDTHETGDVLSRITNDVDIIAHNLNSSISTLVTSITLFIGSITMMLITNWIMALTAILSTILGFFFMFKILNKSQKYFIQKQEELGNLNGYIEEMYSGHNVVKAYNGTKDVIKEFETLNSKLYEANRKSQFLSGLMHPIMGFIGNFGYVMVCIVGALLTMNDVISFGVIVAFMIYIRMFTNPLNQIAQALSTLQSVSASSERVFEFLDEHEMSEQSHISKSLKRSNAKGLIEFKNVKFGYDSSRTIINDFSVKVKPGQKVAIVGPTGAGKTTMVNLLMKFYEINNGDIEIDGISTKDLTRENIHELFIMVLQDTWLFEGTIRDNIKFSNEDVSDREIWSALKTVGVDHFVKTLPGDLDYVIGDNDTISQGQKQLLTIARGMIEDAPFLILDEATSNVDTRTEELVQKAMDKLTEGRTSFIIAHRLSTIKNADVILVMKEGNIVEHGNHENLMEKNGFYAELYNSQFEKVS